MSDNSNPFIKHIKVYNKKLTTQKPEPLEDKPRSGSPKEEDSTFRPAGASDLVDAQIRDLKNNTELRKKTAKYSAILAYSSLAVWSAVVLASLAAGYRGIELLNDTKFIAVTSGATVNVLAAFLVVVKGLFNSKDK